MSGGEKTREEMTRKERKEADVERQRQVEK